MSTLDNPKALFQNSCSTNSEPYALQNIGDMMSPEFSENCIIIIDPSMPCLLYTSPSPRDRTRSRMPSSA